MSKTIVLTDDQFDLLVDNLIQIQDKGPDGEGWKSDELVELIELITGKEY